MRALVTGANGLVGANLVRVLLNDGRDQVRVMVRPTSDTRAIDGLDVERVHGDVRDRDSLRRAMEGCAVVYHLAAVYKLVGEAEEIIGTAVEGTRNALEAASEVASLERIVCTSSIVAVGSSTDPSQICDESWEWNLAGAYAYVVAKRRAEEEAFRIANKRQLPLVVVNPSGVLGRYDTKPTPSASAVLTALNAPLPVPFYPTGGLNLVDAEDVAMGHLLAARQGTIGQRYLLAGENVTYRELMQTLSDVAGTPAPRVPLPRSVGWVMGALAEVGQQILGFEPPLNRELALWHFGRYQWYSTAKAERELGYRARPLRQVLERSVRWFVEDGKVRNPERLQLPPPRD